MRDCAAFAECAESWWLPLGRGEAAWNVDWGGAGRLVFVAGSAMSNPKMLPLN